MTDVEIILPPRADETDALEHGLVTLTEAISQVDGDAVAHGFLGGEFGYGARYENDVFAMRPFYWGNCDCGWEQAESDWSDTHKHKLDCYYIVAHKTIDEHPLQKDLEKALRNPR